MDTTQAEAPSNEVLLATEDLSRLIMTAEDWKHWSDHIKPGMSDADFQLAPQRAKDAFFVDIPSNAIIQALFSAATPLPDLPTNPTLPRGKSCVALLSRSSSR